MPRANFEKGTKVCSKCKREQSINNFNVGKGTPDKLDYYCKSCSNSKYQKWVQNNENHRSEYDICYYQENREKALARSNQHAQDHKEEIKIKRRKYRDIHVELVRKQDKEHRIRRKDKANLRMKERKETDPLFKLAANIRTRVSSALTSKSFSKNSNFKSYIGCTLERLKVHLESQFQPGMTWDNHTTNGWHIDHVIPLSLAKTEEELYKLCHYTNLQPLWAVDNVRKGNKIL